jgi:hypothetical protein
LAGRHATFDVGNHPIFSPQAPTASLGSGRHCILPAVERVPNKKAARNRRFHSPSWNACESPCYRVRKQKRSRGVALPLHQSTNAQSNSRLWRSSSAGAPR